MIIDGETAHCSAVFSRRCFRTGGAERAIPAESD